MYFVSFGPGPPRTSALTCPSGERRTELHLTPTCSVRSLDCASSETPPGRREADHGFPRRPPRPRGGVARGAGWPARRRFRGTASLLEAITRVRCGAGCLCFAGPGSTFTRPRPGLCGVPRREVASSGTSQTVQVCDSHHGARPAASSLWFPRRQCGMGRNRGATHVTRPAPLTGLAAAAGILVSLGLRAGPPASGHSFLKVWLRVLGQVP